jgi:hypothetical protein
MSAIVEQIERLERRGGTPPARSELQRLYALDRANEIRGLRAQLKRDLKAGRVDPIGLLDGEPRDELATMRVLDVLLAVPKTGRVKANTLLRRCSISPSKTLGGLSVRQRYELAERLRSDRARPRLFDDVDGRTQPRRAAGAVRSGTPTSTREEI